VPFAEAQACPQCNKLGKIEFSNAVVGGTLHKIVCRNEPCPWYNTPWFVETDANGEARVNREAYERAHGTRLVAPRDASFDAAFEQVHTMLERQLREETRRD
jgi:hypothetical protein